MTQVLAAVVTGLFAVGAVLVSQSLRKVRRDLDDCLRDRKQLRQVLQLTVSSLVGLLPAEQRDRLLMSIDRALTHDDDPDT